jgi:antitoxin VapB
MMTTLPADEDTERLARKLAEAAGKPVPIVVKEAIAAKAEADGISMEARELAAPGDHLSRDELLARVTKITDGFASIPVRDARSADEIIGYDDLGLPT